MLMHQRRKELEAAFIHAKNYVWVFMKQTLTNFWHTLTGQQIIQLIVCLIVTTGINIYTGIIEFDKAWVNTNSVMYIAGTMLFCVLFTSFVTAPFHLDRERVETIEEKETEISELQVKITTPKRHNQQLISVRATNAVPVKTPSPKPKPKNEPIVECKKAYFIKIDISNDFEININNQGIHKMLLADFEYKKTDKSYQKFDIKAEINIDNLRDNELKPNIKGVWLNNDDNEWQKFIADDVWTVVVGLVGAKELYAYEYYMDEQGYASYFTPEIYKIEGDVFEIKVRLIGQSYSDIVLNKPFKFKLSLEPDFNFIKDEG